MRKLFCSGRFFRRQPRNALVICSSDVRGLQKRPLGERRTLNKSTGYFWESFGMKGSSGVERWKMYCCTESLKSNIWKVGAAQAQCLNCKDEQCWAAALSQFSVPPKSRYHSASCQQENISSLHFACKREGRQGNLVKNPFHQQKVSCFLQSCFILRPVFKTVTILQQQQWRMPFCVSIANTTAASLIVCP